MDNKVQAQNLGNGMLMLRFDDAAQPVFVEKKGKPYVLYGEKNDYPQYLLYLYNNSAKHSAIINGKVDYIVGKGWGLGVDDVDAPENASANAFIKQCNESGESLKTVTEKAALDMEIFNGAYLQVVRSKTGDIAGIYHLDYSTVRSNADNTKFFVSSCWVKYKPDGSYTTNNNPDDIEEFDAYDPNSTSGTQVLYLKKYHPGIDIYTLPGYRGSITWIEVDIEIGNYHLNNVKGGFFVNKLINFNNGVPAPEDKRTIEKMFEQKFGGVRGRKYMLAYNSNKDNAATVEDLNVAESDKLFDQLNKTTQQEIFTGHRVTSPMLFGVKTEGQLGGRSEMRDAYEAFQNTYVNARQQYLEEVINMVAEKKGITTPLVIQRTEPISFEFSESTQAQNMSKDEIREKMGLPPEQVQEATAAQKVIDAINSLSPLVANKVLDNLTSDELRGLVNLPPAAPGSLPQPSVTFSAQDDERDAGIFSEFGTPRSENNIIKSRKVLFTSDYVERMDFADTVLQLTTVQRGIVDILNRDPLTTQQILAEALGVDVQIINNAIRAMVAAGALKVTEKKVRGEVVVERKPVKEARKIIEEKQPVTRAIEVKYSYEGPKDDKNRAFCKKLLDLDRLYTRKEIELISTRLGYSVWMRRGGWYTVPGTNVHRPYCRHSWVSNVVVKNVA